MQFIQPNQAAHEKLSSLRLLDGSSKNDGWRRFVGYVLYGNALFQSTFKVWDKGIVEMMDDQPIVGDLPAQGPRFDGIFRMR